MQLIFWVSAALIGYAYVGYPALLSVFGKKRPTFRGKAMPSVSIVIAAHNEEGNLPRKLQSLRSLEYPRERLQIVIISDGSTDRTVSLLREAGSEVVPVILESPRGKAEALNRGIAKATGEIVVFLDMRQTVDADAVSELVSCFADPSVGAVSGELMLESADGIPSSDALGIYWRIEKLTRKLESETGSVVGATGAIYAIRRELYQPIPPGTLLDDVLIPMQVARAGKRVLFHSKAIARDRIFPEPAKEFRRKVRTLTGNYQLLRIAPWLLTFGNPLLLRLLSHKLLRLVVPLLLLLLLLASATAPGRLYRSALLVQVFFYTAALLGYVAPVLRRQRIVAIAYTFTMLNVAAAVAFYNFLGGRTRWA